MFNVNHAARQTARDHKVHDAKRELTVLKRASRCHLRVMSRSAVRAREYLVKYRCLEGNGRKRGASGDEAEKR